MTILKTTAYLILVSLLLSACTSTPYTRHKSPKISGSISFNGTATPGVSILLSLDGSDTQCLKPKTRTVTGPNGEFVINSIKDELSYTPLMTHYLDEWVLCAEHKGQRGKIYSDNRYGMGSVISSVHIRCDFETNHINATYCTKTH